MGFSVKRLRGKSDKFSNGEVDFIVEELTFPLHKGNIKYFDEDEIKKNTKRDAAKPLFLTRDE
jgi:hypothetical protein